MAKWGRFVTDQNEYEPIVQDKRRDHLKVKGGNLGIKQENKNSLLNNYIASLNGWFAISMTDEPSADGKNNQRAKDRTIWEFIAKYIISY